MDSKPKPTTKVERRRPGTTSQNERQRAETPQRQRPGAQPPPPSTPSGSGPVSSGGLPSGGNRKMNPFVAIIVLVILAVIAICGGPNLLSGGGDEVVLQEPPFPTAIEQLPTTQPPAPRPTATRSPAATRTPAQAVAPSSADGDTWLVMLYQDADDKILEQDIYIDLNEAERIGSTANVSIVAQVDRFRGAYTGDGDWSSTKRFYITKDDDLQRVRSKVIEDLGEVNMSAAESLIDFVTWAVAAYPADKHLLILSDHGMGWPGGWSDPAPGGPGLRGVPLSNVLGDQLYLTEIDQALGEIRRRTGLDRLEVIGMDACLMGHLEVFTALAPHARYAVASQEIEPALGWAYTGFLSPLVDNPSMDGAELSKLIVASYIQEDQRIQDDQARAEFLRQGSPMGSLFGIPTAAEVARQLEGNITLTAFDLGQTPPLLDAFNAFTYRLAQIGQRDVARARQYAQSFTSIFGSQVPPSYIDLGSFTQLVMRESGDRELNRLGDVLLKALRLAVIAEKHGPKKPGATGVSIYFPNSQLFRTAEAGPQSYTAIADRFAKSTTWDDFLTFHYTGRTFDQADALPVVPSASAAVRGPGAGGIQVSPIQVSARVAAPGRPVTLTADVSGANVGYIYLFAGYYDSQANSIFVADMDFLASPETRELDGVYYPAWDPSGEFTLEFDWEPLMFAISDGRNQELALLTPLVYGDSSESAVYTVEGIYTFQSGEQLHARLFFADGKLRQVFGITGQEDTGAPREIIPQPGDQFTILQKWLDLDSRGQVTQSILQPGGTLTFGSQTFTWVELDAAVGDYLVGLIVADLDGNQYPVYATVQVE